MRIAAQLAMLGVPLAVVAMFYEPRLMFGGVQLLTGACLWVVAWYVLFTLPRELVDRHASRLGASRAFDTTPTQEPSGHQAADSPESRGMTNAWVRTSPLGRL
jgi:hypothetical protein